MNLFDNILQSSTNKFLGTQPSVPSTPSFTTPQAPKTVGYTPPVTVKKTTPTLRNNGFAPGYENTVDQTQSPVFKVVQAGADLFTGITKRLGETVQQDKTKFEQDVKKKQVDFANAMLSKGYAKEDIFKKLNELKAKGEFDFKPGVAESIVGGVGERMQSVLETTQKLSQIQNPLERTFAGVIPYAGQTVASVTQPIASALEPYVSPVVKAIVEKTGQTENIQDLSNQWSQFEKTNPILAENIAGALNVAQLAPVPFAKPIGNAIEKGVKTGAKAIVKGAEVVAPRVVEGIKTGVKATEEGIGKITKSIVSQQSGLGTPSIESILKNPELQGKIRSGELSAARTLEEARTSIDALREGFRETGKMYDTIRKSNVKVGTNEAKQVLLSQLESDGLATGGKINLVDLPVKDRGAIIQALKYIDEYKGEMTPQSALSIRQKLDDLINYKSDVGSNGQRIVTGLRAKYDEFLGQKLPGLKEIDAKYAPERQFWESIRKDIYKADGTLKDNALSVISNITNKGNESKLARMESILPGIGEKVKALRAFEDIQASSGIKVGTYARNLSTVGLATVNPILAIGAWVATHPIVVSRVLESIGLASQKIKSILAKGKNITKEEATIIQEAIKKTPKSKVESIINNLSYDPKTSKLTSKTLIKKPIVKPNTIKNESKVNKPVSSDTIPEGYFKNAFGEIVKKPGYKKGGFVKIGSEPKPIVKRSADLDTKLIEEARKYKSAEEYLKDNSLKRNKITNNDNAYQKGGYDGVVQILEDADSINLTLIELKEKGTGKGTEIIRNLKQYADAKDKKLKIIKSSNDKYWDSFKFLEKGADGRYVYNPNTKPFIVEGRRGLDYKTPKEMIGKEVSYDGKNYEIINFLYSDESGTLYYKIKGSDGNKIVTPDKLSKKIEGIVQKDKEIVPEIIKPKKILGKKISKADEEHLFKKKNTRK